MLDKKIQKKKITVIFQQLAVQIIKIIDILFNVSVLI